MFLGDNLKAARSERASLLIAGRFYALLAPRRASRTGRRIQKEREEVVAWEGEDHESVHQGQAELRT
jgi:hypothetical protein